jgi:tetratricopeptide (TPR) repeat protein
MLSIHRILILLFQILVMGSLFYLGGCASSKTVPDIAEKPQRQDLYQGQSHVALSAAMPQSERQALDKAIDEERSGDLDRALYSYIQALDFNPKNADTFYHIARIQLAKGSGDIAYRAYKEALAIEPNHLMANAELGILEMSQRQYVSAREHLEKAVTIDQQRVKEIRGTHVAGVVGLDELSPLRVYNAIAILDDLENRHEQAREVFKQVLAFQPQSAVVATNLGYSYYLTGDFDNAESYLRNALREDGSFDRAWTNLGLIYIRKGQYSKALASFEQTMTRAEAFNDLGYFLMLEGQYAKAIDMFQQAIDSSPSYFERAQKNLKIAQASQMN